MVLTLCESNAKAHQETGNFEWMNSAVHNKSAASSYRKNKILQH